MKMKNIITGILLSISIAGTLSSCGGHEEKNTPEHKDTTVVNTGKQDTITFTTQNVSKEEYCAAAAQTPYCGTNGKNDPASDSLSEMLPLDRFPQFVKRNGNNIEVYTKKGKQVFQNKNGEEEMETYFVYRVFDPLLVALKVYYNESYDYVVIDLETGQSFHTWGEPVPQEHGHMLVAGNTDLIAGFTNNGLQLYAFEDGKWNLKMERAMDDWGPKDMLWLNKNEILCKKLSLAPSGTEYKTEYVKVILKEEKMD